ncbi:MAG: transposase [Burkholderiaceae bacterium]|nr:transposase [Burkholderiaceae bacterium]
MQEKRTRRTFSAEFKQSAVNKVLIEGRPIAEVARDLDINRVSLDNWIKAAKTQLLSEGSMARSVIVTETKENTASVAEPEVPIQRRTLTLKAGVHRDKSAVRVQQANSPEVAVIDRPMAYVAPDPMDLEVAFAQVKDTGEVRPKPLKRAEPEVPVVVKPRAKNVGAKWAVQNALDQFPGHASKNKALGYKDTFVVPAESLEELWEFLRNLKEKDDKIAFCEMVSQEGLTVSEEVLANPRLKNVENDTRTFRKPWQKPQARLDPVAQDFFKTTPDYTKSVYESNGPLTLRLAPFSEGSPVLNCVGSEAQGWQFTVDFQKFDRFVDEFYGGFVNECKTILMQHNPKEYHSLNAFIRYPDQPAWNPKLWAGERTFFVLPGQSFAEAWLKSINAI